jgi:glycosyltransferase involved in cell wall biosynthesis
MKLTALMQVYNEELCLYASLMGLLPVVDELVIIDGGADGPSTDGSKRIIDAFARSYPRKIVYLFGQYIRDDGAWDEPAQVNDGIAAVTGDYLMRTHADMVFDTEQLRQLRAIIERFPDKKYFYAPLIDFGIDTEHMILQGRLDIEPALRREICHPDSVAVAMAANPRAIEIGEHRQFGVIADVDFDTEALYLPHFRRYHYSYCKPMPLLVDKYVRCVAKNDFGEVGERLKKEGREATIAEAVKWVRELPKTLPVHPYTGDYPENGAGLRGMNVMEGSEQFADY